MYTSLLFWCVLCAHLTGDFYFQSTQLFDLKSWTSWKTQKAKCIMGFLKHCGLYSLSIILFTVSMLPKNRFVKSFIFILTLCLIHAGIEVLKMRIEITIKKNIEIKHQYHKEHLENSKIRCDRYLFLVSQLLNFLVIMIVFYVFKLFLGNYEYNLLGNFFLTHIDDFLLFVTPLTTVKILFVFLAILRPANITIKTINKKSDFWTLNPSGGNTKLGFEKTTKIYKNAGTIIGYLERSIVVILLAFQQYAAIGLVFTAKTLTRYGKISEDQTFGEYYLIGTFLSILISLIVMLFAFPPNL